MLDALVSPALLAFFVAAASPGPATLAVSTTAMARGARAAVLMGVGLAIGLAFWGLIAAAGLGALLVQSSVALTVLRWFGGAYLLWLAWQSARSAVMPEPEAVDVPTIADSRILIRGLVLNLSNPKAVLAWISVLALGVGSSDDPSRLAITTSLCGVLGLVIYLAYAVLFSQAPVRSGYRKARRGIDGVAAAFFGYSGLKLVFTRSEAA
ncbi:LysE family translocator [Amaricoccus sp.]|uniref:LysE family translocator n=1 Tax=Amaricoccus sp. TaxID=1872485 RepID=UPI002B50FF47|nr:LysE family transporter [Amaricoccus sp.]HMQ92342.1 LysE family transporter [Amaricoccus sp.]HMR37010.1 LysE family transporter [Paracoccus sp. (in: a-proteobacteria)]